MKNIPSDTAFVQQHLQFRVLQLNSWPPMPQVSTQYAHVIARICALLARKPTTGMLIPPMLGLSASAIYPLLNRLFVDGHIRPSAMLGDTPALRQGAPKQVVKV